MGIFDRFSVIIVFFLTFSAPLRASTWIQVYQERVGSIVVVVGSGICSGSLVDEKLVLTAWHCVSDLRPTSVLLADPEEKISAQVIAKDSKADLALLRLERVPEGRQPVPLVSVADQSKMGDDADATPSPSVQEGQSVATIGHPLALRATWLGGALVDDRSFMISSGIVSKVNPKNIVSDLSVSPGNSGGPLFNEKGEIVGVASSKLVGLGAGQIGFFTPAPQLHKLMEDKDSQRPLHWTQANHRSGLILTTLRDVLFNEVDPGRSHYGVEFAVEFWDRWRWSLGLTRPGSEEQLRYWRTGYSHSLRGHGFNALKADISLGENRYSFFNRNDVTTLVAALGLELRGLRLEWGHRLNSEHSGDYFILGLRLGR